MQGAEEHGANTPCQDSGGFARSNNALDHRSSNAKLAPYLVKHAPYLGDVVGGCDPQLPPPLASCRASPLRLRTRKPGSDPLSDNLPLKFGKYAHHLEQRFAGRRLVSTLVHTDRIHPYGMKFAERGNKILERPAQPMYRPSAD